MKYLKILFSLLAMILISNVYGLAIDSPQYRVDNPVPDEKSPNIIHPGDDVSVWFKITNNNYDKELKDIKVIIKPHYPYELRQVNPTKGIATISHLNGGESDTVYFKLHVNENAPSQDYRIDVTVVATEYETKGNEVYEREINFTKIYYLPIYGIAKFEIDINNNTISPSESKVLKLTLKNKGTGVAKYLMVNFEGTKNVNLLGSTTYYLESLNPRNEKSIQLNIYATPEVEDGIHTVTTKISWIGEDGNQYNSTIPINLKVVKKIHNNQPYIYLEGYRKTQDGYEVTIGMANRGTTKLKHCVLALSGGPKELNNNHIKYIGDLDEDDYDTAIFDFSYDDLKNTTVLRVNFTYFDEYHNEYYLTETFNIHTRPKIRSDSNKLYYWIAGGILIVVVTYLYIRRKKKVYVEE